jgi:hypothetical protein
MQKSFRCTTSIFSQIPCHTFLCPLLPSLTNVLGLLSHLVVLCLPLCSLSYVSVPCLLSSVPCLMTLFLVSRPLSHVSVTCLPSSVPCLMALLLVSRPLSLVSWLCSLSPVPCLRPCPHGSHPCPPSSVPCLSTVPVSPFLLLYSTVPVLCSSVTRPLFLHLLSSVPCLSYLRDCEIFLKNILKKCLASVDESYGTVFVHAL